MQKKDDVFSDNIADNTSRVAKNTLMLCVRMSCLAAINFFTTREVLSALGDVDFGIANIVGGVVSMFQFLGLMLSNVVSRYFSYYLGCKDYDGLGKVFSLIRLLNAGLAVLVAFLCETVGVFVFYNYLNLPKDSVDTAFIFFQFAVFTFVANLATTPYTSLVISRENMKVFSLFSVLEAVSKLAIVYALYLDLFVRLEFYGFLLFAVSVAHLALYLVFCKVEYPEAKSSFYWNGAKALEIVSFGGWNFFGSIANLFTNVFVNILLNNFFGVLVNAARGVVVQLTSGINSFCSTFMMAANPQIMKYWSSQDCDRARSLTMRSSKFCFFGVFLFALPVMLEMDFLLKLWLEKVPPYTLVFAELAILKLLIDSYSTPIVTLVHATGRIALYQCVVGITLYASFFVSYIVLKMGFSPESVFVVDAGFSVLLLGERVLLLRRQTGFSVFDFVSKVLGKSVAVAVIASISPFALSCFMAGGVFRFAAVTALSFGVSVLSIWFMGLDSVERTYVFRSLFGRSGVLSRLFGCRGSPGSSCGG